MSIVLCLGASAANSGSSEQDSYNREIQPDSMFFWKQDSVYSFNRYFVSVGGGIGRLMAEDSRKLPFWKEAQAMWTVSAGIWLTPTWGLRAQAGGGSLRGFALWKEGTGGDPGYGGGNWFLGEDTPNPVGRDKSNTYLETAADADPELRRFVKENYFDLDNPRTGKDGSKGYNYCFSYFNIMADLMVNLNSAIWGHEGTDDFLQVMPFGGLGWAHTNKDGVLPKVNNIALRGGIATDMRITEHLRFNVESYLMVVPEVFDRFVGDDRTQDGVFTLTAGLTYRFGKAKAKTCVNRYYTYHMPQPAVAEPVVPVVVPVPVPARECPGVEISGLVRDTTDEPVENATVFVYDMRGQTVKVLRSEGLGAYLGTVPCGAPLVIKAVKSGYIDDCFSYTVPSSNTGEMIREDVPVLRLDRLKKDKVICLDNIYYDFNKWDIRSDAAVELDKVVTFLLQHPCIFVELGSHTDSRGSFAYNDALSQKRAESAVAYIVGSGISAGRITAKGYGERQLIEKCPDGVKCTEEQHQANRRTEIKILDEGTHLHQTADPWDRYITGRTYRLDELPAGFFDKCDPRK